MIARTEHLIIRDPVLDDWEQVHWFLSDPDVMRWIHLGPTPYTEQQSRAWVEQLIFHNQLEPRAAHNAVIVENETGQVIGWIGIGQPSLENEGDLEFGYALRQDRWGKGYMTEAVKAVLDFAFNTLDAKVVIARCETANASSCRVLEKAGMKRMRTYQEVRETVIESLTMFLYAISRYEISL